MKKEEILKEIIKYYEKNMSMPTIRYLVNKFNYHSTNIIYYYLKKLESDGYLIRNDNHKLVLNQEYNSDIKRIAFINSQDVIQVILKKEGRYCGYKIKDNRLININIIKGDLLIFEITKNVLSKGIGLFKINGNYIVGQYEQKDSLFLIEYDNLLVCEIDNLVGKLVLLERKMKKNL